MKTTKTLDDRTSIEKNIAEEPFNEQRLKTKQQIKLLWKVSFEQLAASVLWKAVV